MTKNNYDRCKLKSFSYSNASESNFTLESCDEWVFSKEYFQDTIVTDVCILGFNSFYIIKYYPFFQIKSGN